ncbi:hypothetical protein THASP1DRAFT_33116 [Thamnocephalis sphaerospora]|uniref:Uncharacterized protein n=1 Tax=Thamnocephalis sphaerospora TaxID=78915 RepID=A0A4P9XHB9_9FUNG|nr:hypothetical protein THASP1DRAFT_33116 [Thamnocephalis sphaerospora]|eukprot:RKP05052.1 hypothetical protein THASP1DRAFT_33116 [Thamnocephalis sphaerospora]
MGAAAPFLGAGVGAGIPLWNATNSTTFTPINDIHETGSRLRRSVEGLKAKHPVILIPGFGGTGLAVTGSDECAKKYSGQKMWTSYSE